MDPNNTRTSGPMWNLRARSFHIRFIYPPSIKKVKKIKQKILKKYINNPLFKYQLTISIKSSNVKPAQFELLWTKMFQSRDQAKYVVFVCFLAFDFCRFCVVIRFFHPRHNGQWPPTSKDFLSQILSITLFSYLNSWERASISLFNVEC